jgi:hypothetical protein
VLQEDSIINNILKVKKGPVVNVAKLDPQTPIPLDFGSNPFTVISGQRYLPFLGDKDNFPNTMWEARILSLTHNACVTSIAQTCVGSGIYVTNLEIEKVDKEFLTFIANLNSDKESLADLVRAGIDCMETDGNAWPEIVKGTIGAVPYVKAYMHSSLICRLGDIPKEKTKPDSVVRSIKFAERRDRIVSNRSLKAAVIPLYSDNPLDRNSAWKKNENGDLSTMLHLKNTFKGSLFYGLPRGVAGLLYQILEGRSAQYNIDNFENGMVLSGAIIFKGAMTQGEANLAAKEIIRTHTGAGKNGRIAVISSENGIEDFVWQPFETQKEGSYIELDKRIEQKIITASNWDSIFFSSGNDNSLGKGSTYVRAVYDVKLETVINPICNYWMEHFIKPFIIISAEHLSKPEWLTYELGYKTAMPFSYSSDIDVNAVVTPNEGRDFIGLPGKKGTKWEDEPIKDLNKQPQNPQNVPPQPAQ